MKKLKLGTIFLVNHKSNNGYLFTMYRYIHLLHFRDFFLHYHGKAVTEPRFPIPVGPFCTRSSTFSSFKNQIPRTLVW